MQSLQNYLASSGASLEDIARSIAVDAGDLGRMLAGEAEMDRRVAQRIVDITDGAVSMTDLLPAMTGVVNLGAHRANAQAAIDQAALTSVLAEILPALVGGAKRKGDEHLPRLAADAVANAYEALSSVTTRRNADRLVQALLPVFAEILEEASAPPSRRREAAPLAEEAAARYLRATPQRP